MDVWGSMKHSGNYYADSLTNIFSSTKSLTSLAMAMLVDMRHEAGLVTLDHELDQFGIWTSGQRISNRIKLER